MPPMLELPPEVSSEMAKTLFADDKLHASTLNEKWSLSFSILYLIELQRDIEKGVTDSLRKNLAKKVGKHFKGRDKKTKEAHALTAINRALRKYEEYKQRNPYQTCSFELFLARYELKENEPVPFSKGIQIITAQDKNYHLGRARQKFDELSSILIEAERKNSGSDNLPMQRRRTCFENENLDENSAINFYVITSPNRYPKAGEEIPEDLFFHAADVWHLWKEASKQGICRPRKTFF